ncbi:MAG TPA: hypothetical protein VEL11_06145 [Candidatus Bathyarchaeia archaeon]|nr:hypothetical protein [Candidatus Bathyarchaeia archaeon]
MVTSGKPPSYGKSFNLSVCCGKGMEEKGSEHRKAFGQFSSNKTQRLNTSEPVKLELNSVSFVHFRIDFNKGDIVIKQRGIYLLIACPQIGKVRGITPPWLDFWVRVNNIDVSNSNIRTVVTDAQEKTVVPLNVVLPLDNDDTLNIMMATETMDEGLGLEAIAPIGEPTIPSILQRLNDFLDNISSVSMSFHIYILVICLTSLRSS